MPLICTSAEHSQVNAMSSRLFLLMPTNVIVSSLASANDATESASSFFSKSLNSALSLVVDMDTRVVGVDELHENETRYVVVLHSGALGLAMFEQARTGLVAVSPARHTTGQVSLTLGNTRTPTVAKAGNRELTL